MVSLFLMLWDAVALVQWKKLFTTAPRDIQAAAKEHEERSMLVALVLIIGVWNGVRDFKTAYLQALLFLEVMNWYDGIVIDRLWVGHSRFWVIPGTEHLPFVKPWKFVLTRRGLGMLAWAAIAVIVAALVVWIL